MSSLCFNSLAEPLKVSARCHRRSSSAPPAQTDGAAGSSLRRRRANDRGRPRRNPSGGLCRRYRRRHRVPLGDGRRRHGAETRRCRRCPYQRVLVSVQTEKERRIALPDHASVVMVGSALVCSTGPSGVVACSCNTTRPRLPPTRFPQTGKYCPLDFTGEPSLTTCAADGCCCCCCAVDPLRA